MYMYLTLHNVGFLVVHICDYTIYFSTSARKSVIRQLNNMKINALVMLTY